MGKWLNAARAVKRDIVTAGEFLSDEQAVECSNIYDEWSGDSMEYKVGDRRRWGDVLYKCRQAHTSQEIYPPNIIPAIWVAISEDAGTQDAPVTAVRGMEYEADKCYIDLETNKLYRCTRGGILQYLPHELVGHYFEEVAV